MYCKRGSFYNMKTLPPQNLTRKDIMPLADVVFKVFQKVLFKPLLDIAAAHNAQFEREFSDFMLELKNASDTPLMVALRTGLVQYKDGMFTGSFSREISSNLRRLGATFNKRTGTYNLPASEVPVSIKAEAAAYDLNARGVHEAIIRKLNEIQTGLDHTFETFELDTESAIAAVEKGFNKTARGLGVAPELSAESRAVLKEEYTENLKLFIKKFTETEIHALREETEKNAVAGYRFDRLAATIQDQYKVSAVKAEFLARQETSLFMSKFREQRFGEAGVTRYIWRTSKDQRVRDQHKHLEGKIFFYSQPPIVDRATGRKANPGCDFGCRCVDEPILEPIAVGS